MVRAVVDCGEMDLGDVREEIVVGNACGEKARQPWKRADTAESCGGGGAITRASPSPHTSFDS